MGRGGATTFQMDLANADCILIMGSNFAEAHPVGYRFVMRARERGATIIHVDPRFTRTSASASRYAQIRAGTDIAFLGGLIRHVLHSERWQADPFFREYVLHYTNAATLVSEEFRDVDELGGLFSGWDPEAQQYHSDSWQFEGEARRPTAMPEEQASGESEDALTTEALGPRSGRTFGRPPQDTTLEHPRCVLQVLKRHFARYTPEMVEQITGVAAATVVDIAETMLANSGRERTSAIAYAVGWTQHTTGPQVIASAAILQLLLGNIGRPGGGIQALRGHATIQGSTDIPTLYDLLPGYLRMPSNLPVHGSLERYVANERASTGLWAHTDRFMISLLKAWFGPAATPETDRGYALLPRITGNHSHLPMFIRMRAGGVEGLFLMGQNPAVGGQNAGLQREALGKLKWLVVRDIFPTESATFWADSPEVLRGDVRPEDIGTEVFLLPAATVPEKDGSFTNTQRLIQYHRKAVEPPADARSDAWFMHHLMLRLKRAYAGSSAPKDRPLLAVRWDYPEAGADGEPEIDYVLREINGYEEASSGAGSSDTLPGVAADPRALWAARRQLRGYRELRDDGTTACGCWIYIGVHNGRNRAASRDRGDGYIASDWGFSWPNNVRLLYNRCAADSNGRPWSERKRYLWWDDAQQRWVGADTPDFVPDRPPSYRAAADAEGMDAINGDSPFVLKAYGKAWLFFPSGMKDGPLPTHYEPWGTPSPNALYPEQERNPATRSWDVAGNPYHAIADPRFPHVLTTYRLTEHHTAGGMTRWNSWLAELQPGAFVEISPELAAEKGIHNGGWLTVSTARGEAEARALVTRRMRPLRVAGRTVHQVGFPWHFGYGGIATGAAANDLVSIVAEPNVSIHEGKALTCDVRAGRRRQ